MFLLSTQLKCIFSKVSFLTAEGLWLLWHWIRWKKKKNSTKTIHKSELFGTVQKEDKQYFDTLCHFPSLRSHRKYSRGLVFILYGSAGSSWQLQHREPKRARRFTHLRFRQVKIKAQLWDRSQLGQLWASDKICYFYMCYWDALKSESVTIIQWLKPICVIHGRTVHQCTLFQSIDQTHIRVTGKIQQKEDSPVCWSWNVKMI